MSEIHLWGVKQNNLKNIEVKIPLHKTTVICGPSGSGKSSLAFETLFAEGQRRFIESMSNYARQFLNKAPKPDIEGINNIPPAISIEQKNSVKNSRSTVGTTTEIVDYLRLLFEKISVPHCPTHHIPAVRETVTSATDKILKEFSNERGYILVEIDKDHRVAEGKKLISLLLQNGNIRIAQMSDNNQIEMFDLSEASQIKKGIPKENFYLVIDRLAFKQDDAGRLTDSLTLAYEASIRYNTHLLSRRALIVTTTGKTLKLSEDPACPECYYTPPMANSKLFSFNSPLGACTECKGFGNILTLDKNKVIPNPEMTIAEGCLHPFSMPSADSDRKALLQFCKKQKIDLHCPWSELPEKHQNLVWNGDKSFMGVVGLFEMLEQIKYKMHVRVFISRYRSPRRCTHCNGTRLKPESLSFLINKKNIGELSALTIEELEKFFTQLKLNKFETEVAGEIFKQLQSRLNFLMRVGVHYLTLDRETRTLSGGEYQRLNLANQLGMGLSQTLYVLDEPTVGLHPRDNDRLISILKDLKDLENTVVIVEHDHDVIKNADNILEIGPGSGYLGGKVVFSGTKNDFLKSKESVTAPFINGKKIITQIKRRETNIKTHRYLLELKGASGNNLKNVDLKIPLNRLVCVTGVSGSGKSTLISKTLYPALTRALNIEYEVAAPFTQLTGFEDIKNVLLVDQSSIGKSARSTPITYLKAFDTIRNLMCKTDEARDRGYTPGTFSLNVDGGRCPACRGTGYEEIDMQFMDNVIIPCDVCDTKKYRPEILEIKYNGKNIHEILSMTVIEAMDFFVAHPSIRKPLMFLKDVGLEYITLGQPANSLSGGESQRLKIAKELTETNQRHTLYILDEPTTGLHFREIEMLMSVLNNLIEMGGSVLIVEHNLDVIAASDYIIDLGPEAGALGGYIVAEGNPEAIIRSEKSLTGKYLKSFLT